MCERKLLCTEVGGRLDNSWIHSSQHCGLSGNIRPAEMALRSKGKGSPEAFYDDMRGAIHDNNHKLMQRIIENKKYEINRGGGEDKRTALHTATMTEDTEALAILLAHPNVDPNAKTSRGLTPLLLAAAKGKIRSFEILIADIRVDAHAKDYEDQSVVELANMSGRAIIAKQVKQLINERKRTPVVEAGKLAILIGNSKYQKDTHLGCLDGEKQTWRA